MQLIHPHYYTIHVPVWKDPGRFRLALLADLHNNSYFGLLPLLEKEKPAAVLVAGDMVNRPGKTTPPRFTRAYGCLSRLAKAYPLYYAPGNHESTWAADERYAAAYGRYRRALGKKGVVFLENKSVFLGDEAHPLTISGLELGKESFSHHRDRRRPPAPGSIEALLGKARPYHILLAHHPAYIEEYAAWGADLVLSGHFHGGQGRLPLAGGIIGPGFELFPPYTKGLYRKGETDMIVSAGLGTHGVPFRVLNPREVAIIDLVAP